MTSATIAEPVDTRHPVVSADQWLTQRKALLQREKELLRLHDEVARERRAMPWERVEKNYVFVTHEGVRTLSDLFQGRSQLIVQHFMLGPDWEQGCPSCSYMADHTDGMNIHLAQRDISFVAVSRSPLPGIARFQKRMGWKFKWVSSAGSDFNFDFHVSFKPKERATGAVYYNYHEMDFPAEEAPGVSVFCKNDDGEVFHTYSTFGRGVEVMMGAYRMMDLTPKGRGERDVPNKMEWVRHHDRYEPAPAAKAESCCTQHA